MKVLIIGGSGFIGKAITEYLLKANYDVTLFNRGNTINSIAKQITGDKKDLSAYRETFKQLNPDAVIHTIAYTAQDAVRLIATFSDITKRVIVLSSGDVYAAYDIFRHGGVTVNQPVNENAVLRTNLFPYREEFSRMPNEELRDLYFNYDKIVVENTIRKSNLNYTIIRLAAVYGHNDPQNKLQRHINEVSNVEYLYMSEEQLNWKWTRIFVDNIPPAIDLVLKHEAAINQIYNLGEAEVLSLMHIYALINSIVPTPVMNKISSGKTTAGDLPDFNYKQHLVIDSSKIRNELGYKELVDPEKAMRKLLKMAVEELIRLSG